MYIISFFTGTKPAGTETYRGALDMAKALAMAAVDRGSADRVEVRDINKNLMFHYPRTFCAG
jgi:hypothetical protein